VVDAGSGQSAAAVREKIDARSLQVYSIVITNQSVATGNGGSRTVANVAFEFDGRAHTVEYQVCPLSGTSNEVCLHSSTIYYRLRLNNLFPGQVLVKARACVDAALASSADTCGPWNEQTYSPSSFDARAAGISQQIVQATSQLRTLGLNYHQALADFVTKANACVLHNTEAEAILNGKVRVVEQFIRAPVGWFAQSAENLATVALGESLTKEVAASLGEFRKEISQQLANACLKTSAAISDKSCLIITTLLTTAAGFITAMNPVSAISTMSNTLYNLYAATFEGRGDLLVAANCTAEQELENSGKVIQQQMQALVEKIKDLNAQY
jgi:hypothetical protein